MPPCRQRSPGGACGWMLQTLRTAPTSPSLYPVPCASPPARLLPCAPSARWAAAGGMCPYMFRRSPPAPPARPPRIPAPLALPSAPRTRPDRAPGGGAASGLQHPSPAPAREGAAYSIAGPLACGLPILKTPLPTPQPPVPTPTSHPGHNKRRGRGQKRKSRGRAEEHLPEEPGCCWPREGPVR